MYDRYLPSDRSGVGEVVPGFDAETTGVLSNFGQILEARETR